MPCICSALQIEVCRLPGGILLTINRHRPINAQLFVMQLLIVVLRKWKLLRKTEQQMQVKAEVEC